MENASKVMFLGFAAIIFAVAVSIAISMFEHVSSFGENVKNHYYYRNVWQVGK